MSSSVSHSIYSIRLIKYILLVLISSAQPEIRFQFTIGLQLVLEAHFLKEQSSYFGTNQEKEKGSTISSVILQIL